MAESCLQFCLHAALSQAQAGTVNLLTDVALTAAYEEIKSNTDTTTGSSNSGSTKKHHSSGSSKTATTVKAAKTGDESNIWLPAGMLAVAVLGLGCCMVYRKKKREKAE